ncbi:hypothetical protein BCT64_01250 [Vibrio breoganii]|nr:hypothetical protein BCT64_01250 [Vibrio breoganii]PMN70929.1 hypothetical protein BCT28_02860 [Vibrio breoganii]
MLKEILVTRKQAWLLRAVIAIPTFYLGWQLYNLWFHEYGIPQRGRRGAEIDFQLFFWMKALLFIVVSSVLLRIRSKDS